MKPPPFVLPLAQDVQGKTNNTSGVPQDGLPTTQTLRQDSSPQTCAAGQPQYPQAEKEVLRGARPTHGAWRLQPAGGRGRFHALGASLSAQTVACPGIPLRHRSLSMLSCPHLAAFPGHSLAAFALQDGASTPSSTAALPRGSLTVLRPAGVAQRPDQAGGWTSPLSIIHCRAARMDTGLLVPLA